MQMNDGNVRSVICVEVVIAVVHFNATVGVIRAWKQVGHGTHGGNDDHWTCRRKVFGSTEFFLLILNRIVVVVVISGGHSRQKEWLSPKLSVSARERHLKLNQSFQANIIIGSRLCLDFIVTYGFVAIGYERCCRFQGCG